MKLWECQPSRLLLAGLVANHRPISKTCRARSSRGLERHGTSPLLLPLREEQGLLDPSGSVWIRLDPLTNLSLKSNETSFNRNFNMLQLCHWANLGSVSLHARPEDMAVSCKGFLHVVCPASRIEMCTSQSFDRELKWHWYPTK